MGKHYKVFCTCMHTQIKSFCIKNIQQLLYGFIPRHSILIHTYYAVRETDTCFLVVVQSNIGITYRSCNVISGG